MEGPRFPRFGHIFKCLVEEAVKMGAKMYQGDYNSLVFR